MFPALHPLQAALTTPEHHTLWAHYHALVTQPEAQALDLAQGHHAALQLHTWQAPLDLALTALFLPLAALPDAPLAGQLAALPAPFAARVETWLNLHQVTQNPDAQAEPAYARSLKLRQLMRLAYLDLPVVILTLADQAARLAAHDPTPDLWPDMEDIYLPLLRMLGLWQLRREWQEFTARHAHPREFDRVCRAIKQAEPHRYRLFEKVRQRLTRQGVTQPARLNYHGVYPGTVLYRTHEDEALDEQLHRLTIDLIMPNTTDCYKVLEKVHQLGQPLSSRFADLIAHPHSNGYRALHTTIRPAFGEAWPGVVTFRIRTEDMEVLNQHGVLAAHYFPGRESYAPVPTWWQANPAVLTLLRDCPIGAPPKHQVYVFTPRGDVRQLTVPSTALDFAYALHTDLGHHCRAVRINHQMVPHGTALRPGDLVALTYDPFFNGPDPAWLHLTRNPHTRQKIKRGLGAVRRAIHPGRQQLQRYLESLERLDGFVIPEPRLERHLETLAQRLGFGYTEELYEALVRDSNETGRRISVNKLVAYLLEIELAMLVVDETGAPLLAEPPNPLLPSPLHFCANCKPVPEAPIFLHRRNYRGRERLTVHRAAATSSRSLHGLPQGNDLTCQHLLPPHEIVTGVGWREIPPSRRLTNITVLAEDRQGLLGDVLSMLYRQPNVQVLHVEAGVDDDQTAHVLMTAEHLYQSDMLAAQASLHTVRDVLNVSLWPASGPRQAQKKSRALSNPYSSGNPVQHHNMFFGRQAELDLMRQWLNPRNPVALIHLYGQRRVGKTSFAQMLGYHALRDLPVRPVLVDMLYARHDLSPATLYRLMMEEIYRVIYTTAATDPAYKPWLKAEFKANPDGVFRRYVRQVLDDIKPQRLLLMLDEFNVVVEEGQQSAFFDQLRAMTMHAFPELTVLLITHTSQYHQRQSYTLARNLLGQARPLEMPALDDQAARQLVTQPLHGILKFDPTVVDDIVTRTGGNAYLINQLCFLLVQHLLDDGRRFVRRDDLRQALRALWRDGDTYFAFINERLNTSPTTQALITALAHQQLEHTQRVPLALVARRAQLPVKKALDTARYLHTYGVLELTEAAAGPHLRLTVDYFRAWLRGDVSPG